MTSFSKFTLPPPFFFLTKQKRLTKIHLQLALQTYSRQALVAIVSYAPICSVRFVLLSLLALPSWRETTTTALHIGHFIETMPFDPRNKSNNRLFLQQGQATCMYSSSTLCTS